MKQMISVAGGILFAISILCLILAGFFITEKNKFEKELESRDTVTRNLNKNLGWDDTVNKPNWKLYRVQLQVLILAAGVTGSTAVCLTVAATIAGRSKERTIEK